MTAPEPRCVRSDLPESMCAHCRGQNLLDGPLSVEADSILDASEVGARFTARYDGRCAVCDARIYADDSEIAMLVDGSGVACTRHLP